MNDVNCPFKQSTWKDYCREGIIYNTSFDCGPAEYITLGNPCPYCNRTDWFVNVPIKEAMEKDG